MDSYRILRTTLALVAAATLTAVAATPAEADQADIETAGADRSEAGLEPVLAAPAAAETVGARMEPAAELAAAAPAAPESAATPKEPGTASGPMPVYTRRWKPAVKPRAAVRRPTGTNKAIAFRFVAQRSWTVRQFRCLDNLWTRESNWNHRARNSSSGAYGIPQALPADKMAATGTDWRSNPATQIRWGLRYIKDRYGSPCGAWGHFQSHNWY